MKERLDKKLVSMGLALTRSQALQYIQAGQVFETGIQLKKPSYLTSGENLEVLGDTHYVGRGAHKILGALKNFKPEIADKIAIDVGASTGGFTQVLLENNAAKIYAVDVGHDQLDSRLKADPRVIDMPGVNIRGLESLPDKADLIVSDLSFIGLELVLPAMKNLLKDDGEMIILVKPQFEVGKEGLDKHGLVKDRTKHFEVLKKIHAFCHTLGLGLEDAMKCSLPGKTGNQEYLFWLKANRDDKVGNEKLQELCQ